ncbi:MAG: Outer rane receptor for ferrienterochelin and colicin, partial [Candidatus Solibacter sp.]|nr:Outer rane receptor for ferrienterochelin and colicin [Candidatus Solibacter sp.]
MRHMAILSGMMTGTALYAQFESATILGSVRDPQGGAIIGASVVLNSLETGVTARATTDANGNYQFVTVRIGHYDVA